MNAKILMKKTTLASYFPAPDAIISLNDFLRFGEEKKSIGAPLSVSLPTLV